MCKAARNQHCLLADVVAALDERVSSRGVRRQTKGAESVSTASRMWVERSMEQLEEVRSRPLVGHGLLAIQINGVAAGRQMVVMALGVDKQGNKHALNFEAGSSESKAVVEALIL